MLLKKAVDPATQLLIVEYPLKLHILINTILLLQYVQMLHKFRLVGQKVLLL